MKTLFAGILLLLPVSLFSQNVTGPYVRITTNLGDVDVQLLPDVAPKTVENFLRYVNAGSYNNSIFHRLVRNFVLQGGGYQFSGGSFKEIPSFGPVVNEYNVSNTRGTIAMAKLGDDPNSATNQWFFNLGNNSANLNSQNGGFTVFGRIVDSSSLRVMDKLAAVPIITLESPFDAIPLIDYTGSTVQEANTVRVLSITQLDTPKAPVVEQVVSASNYGAYSSAAPGSYIEIYGSNLATGLTREWLTQDFLGLNAPSALEGTSVTVNGRPTFMSYVSPTQLNVQLPAGVQPGTASLVVTANGQSSEPVNLEIRRQSAGVLAPASFKIADKQFVAGLHAPLSIPLRYTTNGNIAGLPDDPAAPGETIVIYGIGFGVVNPATVAIAGQRISAANTLAGTVQFNIGSLPAQVDYAGLVQREVGLYQFNVVVPSAAPNGDLPVEIILNGEKLSQTLYIPVRARQN